MQPSVSAVGTSVMPKLVWKALTLQQSTIYRTVALFDGAALCWNAGNGLATLLVTRTAVETVAFLAAMCRELEQAVKDKDTKATDDVLMRHTFASRSERLAPDLRYRSVNVLTHIRKLDKDLFGSEDRGFLACYDTISEMVHPNYLGTTQLFGDLHPERYERSYDLKKPLLFAAQHIVAALGAVAFTEHFMVKLDRAITELRTFAP
jgi:hypothetical protein